MYAAILERPSISLFDFLSIDLDTMSKDELELLESQQYFSAEKYLYLFYQLINLIQYLEDHMLFIGDFSPFNLMIS